MSRYPKFIFVFLFFIVMFLMHGCYTAFTHPPVNQARWGNIYVTDDCLECHDDTRYSAPILPDAAQGDYNWQFYSGSAWWQDEESIVANVADEPSNGTGPRSAAYTPSTAAPVAMPVQGGGVSLGKQNASDQSSVSTPAEPKRSVGRRSNTTSSSNSNTTKEKSSTKSGRR